MGEWRRSEIGYLRPYDTHCDLCGRLVPGRYWSANVAGVERTFCNAEHEEKFRSYWLPLYGVAGEGAR